MPVALAWLWNIGNGHVDVTSDCKVLMHMRLGSGWIWLHPRLRQLPGYLMCEDAAQWLPALLLALLLALVLSARGLL